MIIPLLDLHQQHASMGSDLTNAIQRVVESGAFVNGPAVPEFERAFADYCGVPHAVGCGNGTDALELALEAVGVGRGDRVATVAHTFIATVEAILNVGAEPILVDVDPRTLVMSPEALERTLSTVPDIRAVVPVHLYGGMADIERIVQLARARDAAVVEDAAQAHGARFKGRRAGSFGDAATFSFFPGKNLGALGDAGALVTSNATIAARVAAVRDHGRREKYLHDVFGRNSRLDSLQASVLTAKLAYLDRWNAGRREVAARYDAALPAALGRVAITDGCEPVFHQYVVRQPKREALRQALSAAGVATGVHYPLPVHKQPAWKTRGLPDVSLPNTEAACKEVLSLPMFPELTAADQTRIGGLLEQALR